MSPLIRALAFAPLLSLSLAAEDAPAPPPVPAPAFVDQVRFKVHADGEDHDMTVTFAPGLLRVDEPKDRYSVIYDAASDHYLGLEHSNYTWWEFYWNQIRVDIENSKRAEDRMKDLTSEGMSGYVDFSGLNTNIDAPPPSTSDTSGYVWHPTTERKRIGNIDCIRWTGDSVSGEKIAAWCTETPQPEIQNALRQLRQINEPMALVPVRVLVPPLVFAAVDALGKGNVTPIDLSWGADEEKNHFTWVDTKQREGKLSYFRVPKIYNKTTLVTMDGMLGQRPSAQPSANGTLSGSLPTPGHLRQ